MWGKYEDELKKSRETKKGMICDTFKENADYKEGIGEFGLTCPNCNDDDSFNDKVGKIYETPWDIKYMCKNGEYMWTENCKCRKCNNMYSIHNGC
ncbi:hypothetical protein [Clostridium butyricum]|uniref:hypothetical protein n=1 Tax=Clostridium butyricum TaxID=1492 RepID=UPI00325BF5E9